MSEPNQQQSGASPDAVKQEGTVTKEDILLAAAIRLGDEIRDQSVEHAKALVKPLISHFKAAIENAVGKEGRDIELVLYGYDECSKINFHALLDCLEVQFIDVLAIRKSKQQAPEAKWKMAQVRRKLVSLRSKTTK
jgi:hypothetical protein